MKQKYITGLLRDRPYRRVFADSMKKNGFACVGLNRWEDDKQNVITIDESVLELLDAIYAQGYDDARGSKKNT